MTSPSTGARNVYVPAQLYGELREIAQRHDVTVTRAAEAILTGALRRRTADKLIEDFAPTLPGQHRRFVYQGRKWEQRHRSDSRASDWISGPFRLVFVGKPANHRSPEGGWVLHGPTLPPEGKLIGRMRRQMACRAADPYVDAWEAEQG